MRFLINLLFVFSISILTVSCNDTVKQQKSTRDLDNPDVVIIGSEIEGMYLARSAADEGLSVVVLDPREKPGGQLIQGEMLFLDEPTDDSNKSLLQGRVKELFDQFKKGDIRKIDEFELYYRNLINGISLVSGITIKDIELGIDSTNNTKSIESIRYMTSDGKEKIITARYWIENTDFAALSSRLEAKRIPGVETVFGGSKDYMAASLMMKFKNVNWSEFEKEVNSLKKEEKEERFGSNTNVTKTFTWGFGKVGASYKPIHNELFLRGLNALNQRDGDVLINALLIFNTVPTDSDRINEVLKLGNEELEYVLPHLRNQLPGWENAELGQSPEYLYFRDYDRFETEYILQAADVLSGRMYWDNVSIAGYPLDLQGTANQPWGISLGDPDKYGIPLRSFILKGYTNVLVAGKNVGASATAYGSARIQPNTSLAGEVIGIILGQIGDEISLVNITERDMKRIHSYIKKEYDITLAGVESRNKLKDYSMEQIEDINAGRLPVK